MKVSVVIPSFNSAEYLKICLCSLASQSRPPHEVIVVDDASTDGSAAIAKDFTPTVILRRERGGAAAARADGAAHATGDIIAFLDSDCAAPSSWIETIAQEFESDPGLGGFGGSYSHAPDKTSLGRLSTLEEEYVHHIFSLHPGEAVPPGGNSAYRKNIWDSARSGKELIHFGGMGSGEDSVVGYEIRQLARIKFSPSHTVGHQSRGGRGYFRRHLNRGISRSTILFNSLSDRAESGLTFKAYGGWSLFFAGICLASAALSLLAGLWIGPTRALACSAAFLTAHILLARDFFGFLRGREALLPGEARLSLISRHWLRVLLFGRSLCWLGGVLIGLGRFLKFRIELLWNVACSILHFWLPGRISKLFYFVNAQCNARCEFCFNLDNVVGWKERKPTELTLAEVTKLAKNFGRMPFLTLSGGEPFLRPDLGPLVRAFHEHAKTQWVTIPTNASLTERTVKAVVEILQTCPGLFLTVQVSIDSMYEDHDRSRKIAGGFAKMTETLKALSKLRRSHKNLRLQIATCYDYFNLDRMDEIVAYCRTNFEYDQQMFYLIRDTRTLITDGNNPLLPDYIKRVTANEEYEWRGHNKSLWHRAVRTLQGLVYGDLAAIKVGKEFLRPCQATQKFATLYDDGQITPCEVLEKTALGNIRDYDFDFYKLKKTRRLEKFHQEEIVEKKCNCDWMCAIPINMLYDPKLYPRIIKGFLNPGNIVGSAANHEIDAR